MGYLLVVEDNEDIAELVEMLLEESGYRVRLARNGEEGLRALRSGELPTLIILDVEMPRLDGPGMAYRLFVEDSGRENIPIVLCSAVNDLKRVAERVGTPYALAKPFTPEALLALIERALAQRALPRPPR